VLAVVFRRFLGVSILIPGVLVVFGSWALLVRALLVRAFLVRALLIVVLEVLD
jgi:hypothetical protein